MKPEEFLSDSKTALQILNLKDTKSMSKLDKEIKSSIAKLRKLVSSEHPSFLKEFDSKLEGLFNESKSDSEDIANAGAIFNISAKGELGHELSVEVTGHRIGIMALFMTVFQKDENILELVEDSIKHFYKHKKLNS